MKDYQIKDKILEYVVSNEKAKTSVEIHQGLGISHDKIYTLCLEMEKSNHIELLQISGSKEYRDALMIKKIPQTNYFYSCGGYSSERKKLDNENWKKHYTTPIVVGVIVAILTSGIDLLQNRSSAQKYEQIDSRIDGLIERMNRIDSAKIK